jgi:hypothetical protein
MRQYLGLFGLPALLISLGCSALGTAFGLDPFNFQNPANLLIAVYFWFIAA